MAVLIRTAFAVLVICLCSVARGSGLETNGAFAAYADSILSTTSLPGASISVMVSSLTTGEVIYQKDADRLLQPASVAKLLSSAAALSVLGPDFRFTTPCLRNGLLGADGTLNGDLILQGGGDPTAELRASKRSGRAVLSVWADSLSQLGLKRIRGNLVMRPWPYTLEGSAPEWEIGDVAGGFAPAVDGFGFNSNVCHVKVLPGGEPGSDAIFELEPDYAPVSIKSRVRTVGSGMPSDLALKVAIEDTFVVISGEIPVTEDGEFFWAPIQNPSLYFGRAFRAALERAGITVDGDVVVDRSSLDDKPTELLHTFQSVPLTDVLEAVNKESDNYAAEYLLRALALTVSGAATRNAGLNAVSNFMNGIGIADREFSLADASGLSRQNLCSARTITRLLSHMNRSAYGETFRQTLSIAGEDGTLGSRFVENEFRGRVLGKTGSMTRICALAGYVTTADGDVLAMAILCNNFRTSLPYVRAAQDRLVKRLITG